MKTKHNPGETFQGVVFDIDGVLEFQGKAYPGEVQPDFIVNSVNKIDALF